MLVGVTGANGFVGSHLVHTLVARGYKVRALVRKQSKLLWLNGDQVEFAYGEIRNNEGLDRFTEGLDVLIHCAALTVAPNLRELKKTNVEGTQYLLDAVRQNSPRLKRFVFISSLATAGRGADPSQPINENVPLRPVTDYGKSKVIAEARVKRAARDIPVTILRPTAVFGPRDKDAYILFKAVSMGVKLTTWYTQRSSMMYVTNLCEAIADAMLHPATVGKTYVLADDGPNTWSDWSDAIAKEFGKPRFVFPVTKWALFVVSYIGTAFSVISNKRSYLNKQQYKLMSAPNLTVDTTAARNDFGFRSKVPLDRAIKETADWYREEKWV